MRREHLRPHLGRNQPVARNRHIAHQRRLQRLLLLPAHKVNRAGERRHHHELRKGHARLQRHRHGRIEGRRPVRRKAEDERPQHMHAVLLERLQLLRKRLARVVEVLEHRLQPLWSHRLHAHQRALDVGLAHRIQILAVFAGLHGDLREEHHVLRQLRQLGHQLEALVANPHQLVDLRRVALLARQPQIGQRHRIEVVVRQRDEPEADAPQRNDLVNHALEPALPRLLPVRPPHAAKRAVLGAAADRLHRRPHVLVRLHQIPATRKELAALDAPALVDRLRRARHAICHGFAPRYVAIALHHGMTVPLCQRLFRK